MRRTRDGSLMPQRARDSRQSANANTVSLSLQTALLVLVALSLVSMYMYTNVSTNNPLLLSNRPAGFRAPDAAGVHADYEEDAVLELAEPTDLKAYEVPTRQFAYLFYVTENHYACMALHSMLRLLNELKMDTNRIDFLVLYTNAVTPVVAELLEKMAHARTLPVAQILADAADLTWQQSLTKLRVFEDFGYERVIYLDSDAVPLHNLDELFELPPAPIYAPTAYWLAQPFFATTLMVITPSNKQFDNILRFARLHADSLHYDMEVLNAIFKSSAVFLPSEYTVLNSDFRAKPGEKNLLYATTSELWRRAKFVHFSCRPDGSYGKPWHVETRDLSFLTTQGIDPFFGQLFVDFWRTEDTVCNV